MLNCSAAVEDSNGRSLTVTFMKLCRHSFQWWQNLPISSEIVQVHLSICICSKKCVLFPFLESTFAHFATKVLVNCWSRPLPSTMLMIQQYPHSSNTPFQGFSSGSWIKSFGSTNPMMGAIVAKVYGLNSRFPRLPMFHPGGDCYEVDPIYNAAICIFGWIDIAPTQYFLK